MVNAGRTSEPQQAGRKVGNWGLLPEGQETSGEVGSVPGEALKLLEDVLRPRMRRWCPFWDLGSSLSSRPAAQTACGACAFTDAASGLNTGQLRT